MPDLFKYGVADHLFKPIIKRGVVDFALGADWTPVAGDVKISKDGGAAANVTNLPTALAMGNTALWDLSLTAAELTAKKIRITVADAATKAVEDVSFEIDTYGHASAQHPFDLGTASVPQSGDAYGVVNDATFGNAKLVRSATPANALAVDANNRTDVGKFLGQAVQLDAGNYPKVGLENWRGSQPNALQGGRVDAYIGAIANGIIAAATFAANALDAVWSTAVRTITGGTIGVYSGDVPQTFDMGSIIKQSSVNDGAASTKSFVTNLTEAVNDHWKGHICKFMSGTLKDQQRSVVGYDGTLKKLTIDEATSAPANGVTFVLIPAPTYDHVTDLLESDWQTTSPPGGFKSSTIKRGSASSPVKLIPDKRLLDVAGNPVTNPDTIIGSQVE